MKSLMATVLFVATLMVSGLAAITAASAAPQAKTQAARISDAADFGAHRRQSRHHSYHRPQPYYYGRPVYYRPYPYRTPAPFTFGIGFGPSWW